MNDQKNELVEVIQIAGLEQNKVESLMSSFSQSYQTARQFVEAYALPAVASKEANAVIRATEVMIGKMTSYIREKAKVL